jgi:VanZ family protein
LLIAITILSGYPGNKIPEAPFLNFDKLVHVGIYFVLSVAICFAFFYKKEESNQSINFRVWIICFGIFYGGFMEILQHYIFINRSGSWYDFFANAIGATIGVVFYPFIVKLLPFKR